MSEEYFRLLEEGAPLVEQPREGKSYTQQYGLSFDGPKLRFEIGKKAWSAKQQRFLETPYLGVFDGQIGKSLWGEQEIVPYPSGTIKADKAHPDISTVSLVPVMLSCRPFGYGNSGFAFPPDEIRKNSEIETINGRRTIRLRQQSGERLLEVWVDSSAAFRVSRFVTSSSGRIDWQCSMDYAPLEDSVIPAGWKLERFSNRGTLFESNSAEVTKVLINPKIPAERFTIEYPVGSVFFDARVKKRFIMQAPGKPREVLRSELKFGHDALMKSSTGRATEGEVGP